jgi:DNA repair exonuclease SbcCD ATPase subunit
VSIKKKKAVLEEIDKCSLDIKNKSDNITKIITLKEYNKKNNDNYEYYLKENIKITETIDILDIIIDNFKTYKIDLYENHILKKLMIKTNSYIKLLCHENTKNFELDFMINEHKDIIHINWLIHNTCSDNTIKQVISINQASGFQKFVISLALRMSLYSNTQTEQLFIDEGFTACDNQNLSLVPSFLKKLLNTFSCIVIVSHIDIIKDSADIIVNIEYDKHTKTSHIKL